MHNSLITKAIKQEQLEALSRIQSFICQYNFKEVQLLYLCPQIRSVDSKSQFDEKYYEDQIQAIAQLNDLDIIYEKQRREKFKQIQAQYAQKMREIQKQDSVKVGKSILGKLFSSKQKNKVKSQSPMKASIYQSPLKTLAYLPKQNDSLKQSLQKEPKQQNRHHQIVQQNNKASQNVQQNNIQKKASQIQRINISHKVNKEQQDNLLKQFIKQDVKDQMIQPQQFSQTQKFEIQENNDDNLLQQMPSYHSSTQQEPKILQSIQEQSLSELLSSYHSVSSQQQQQIIQANQDSPILNQTQLQQRKFTKKINNNQNREDEIQRICKDIDNSIHQTQRQILNSVNTANHQSSQDSQIDIQVIGMMKLQAYDMQQRLITKRIFQRMNIQPKLLQNIQKITFKDYTKDINKKIMKNRMNFGKVYEWQQKQ